MPDQDANRRRRPRHEAVTAASAPQPGHISRIITHNVDELRAWVAALFHGHKRRVLARARGFEYVVESCRLGGLTFTRGHYNAATIEVSWPPVHWIAAGHVLSGRALMRWHGDEVRVGNQGTLLFPSDDYRYIHEDTDATSLTISLDTVLRAAEETTGLDRAQVRFTGVLPISAAAERRWLATERFIQRGMYGLDLDQPLLLAAAEQIVAATLLTTFPNTAMTTEVRTPRDPATPATVRRAIAFIDSHASEPITVTDIAIAVGVLPSTLQYAFRRHHDITPLAYLRQVRLAQAHRELIAAEPGDGTTVAAVAARWGYARPSRFAAAYRQVYGQPPSHTLWD
jgi:AraC-like DNA-binding protein